jgi:2-polyprenyl-3-methyl-5-hydroxy-6-metoxy-1,4-benzoquinol methylase
VDYNTDVIRSVFDDEYQYWDKMSEFSINNDKVYYNIQKVHHIVKFLMDYELRHKQVLEIGCGLGLVAKALITGAMITDYKATECWQGYIDFMRQTTGGRLNAVKAKMNDLPYENGTFDVAFLFDVLEHITPGERDKSYVELDRVMKPKRQIFINTPSSRNISFHNKEFDHPFRLRDVDEFAISLGCDIRNITYYRCPGYDKRAFGNHYHMIEVANL